ncbi:MAG UNVERIFIED_CONTAM: hypothetical protein LVR18_03300 [Planctomycetaceae bacterium]|jgi:hypothetical protein
MPLNWIHKNAHAKQNLSLAYGLTGVDKANAGDLTAGIADLEKALVLDPENKHAKENLSAIYRDVGIDNPTFGDLVAGIAGPENAEDPMVLGGSTPDPVQEGQQGSDMIHN